MHEWATGKPPSNMSERNASTKAGLFEELAALRREVETLEASSARAEQVEGEYALFFTQSLDLLCIAGFDGYFKRLNPVWTTSLGWTLDELQTKPFLDFVHPDDRAATLAEVDRLADGAESLRFENRYRHRDGSYRWLRWSARSVSVRQEIYATARDVTQQKRLEREILEVVDREKERLGRELHDGLCQTLAGIAALSSTLSKTLAANSEFVASAAAADINELLNEAIGEARDLARGLGPVGLGRTGFDAALEALALNVQHRFRISCTLECDRPVLRPGREVEAHLFRIAQEAVNNAVTHGRAKRIDIGLSAKDGAGLLSVRDDGVGLPEESRHAEGIGLHTMAYRARLIGGSLDVRRRSPRGTAVTCSFPLPAIRDGGANQRHASDNT
jgi:PAS domain S-box-containing protein